MEDLPGAVPRTYGGMEKDGKHYLLFGYREIKRHQCFSKAYEVDFENKTLKVVWIEWKFDYDTWKLEPERSQYEFIDWNEWRVI